MAAVRLAELLMARHQSLYAKHFRKEGVVHALQALSATAHDAVERPQVGYLMLLLPLLCSTEAPVIRPSVRGVSCAKAVQEILGMLLWRWHDHQLRCLSFWSAASYRLSSHMASSGKVTTSCDTSRPQPGPCFLAHCASACPVPPASLVH